MDSFGRLVKLGGAITSSEMSRHIEDMLQLLNGSDVLSSTVALRLLAEFAKNAPARFNLYADKFVANFYHFLFHDDASLQQDAINALRVNARVLSFLMGCVDPVAGVFGRGCAESLWEETGVVPRSGPESDDGGDGEYKAEDAEGSRRIALCHSTLVRKPLGDLPCAERHGDIAHVIPGSIDSGRSYPDDSCPGTDLPSELCPIHLDCIDGLLPILSPEQNVGMRLILGKVKSSVLQTRGSGFGCHREAHTDIGRGGVDGCHGRDATDIDIS